MFITEVRILSSFQLYCAASDENLQHIATCSLNPCNKIYIV